MAHDLSNLCQRPPNYCPAVFFAQRSSSTDMRDASMSQRFLLHQQNGHVRAKVSLPRASRQGETLPDAFPSPLDMPGRIYGALKSNTTLGN